MAERSYIGVNIGGKLAWQGTFSWEETPRIGNDLASIVQGMAVDSILGGMEQRVRLCGWYIRNNMILVGDDMCVKIYPGEGS